MSIIITINSESAAEAQAQVLDLSAVMGGSPIRTAVGATSTPEAPKTSRSRSTAKPTETIKEPEAKVNNIDTITDDAVGGASGEQQEQEENDAPVPTVVDLRARAGEIGKTPDGKKAIKGLLDQYGSKSLSDISEGQRTGFMADLEALEV